MVYKKKMLVYEKDGTLFSKDILVLKNAENLKPVLNNERWRILKKLNEKPDYPSRIAKELNIHEQKAYYHIRLLKNNGLIKVVEEKEIRGATARLYSPITTAFGVELDDKGRIFEHDAKKNWMSEFLSEFSEDGVFNGYIVVGAPDPHGPHKARARDGHYATHLAFNLGKLFETNEFTSILDVDAIAEKKLESNMIVIGGPVTNLVMKKINKSLPVYFSDEKPWGLHSSKTNNDYTDDHVGMICKIKNPWNETKTVIAIAGIRFIGTKAAVMALSKDYNLFKNGEKSHVVRGFDYDGDGKIDTIEILE